MLYTVTHDNTFDNPTEWIFENYADAIKLRDKLNQNGSGPDGKYHVEEEIPDERGVDEIIEELTQDGWFD